MRILAFDIGGTNIKYAICDEKFKKIFLEKFKFFVTNEDNLVLFR